MNRKQTILSLVKSGDIVKVRCLDELSLGIVAPAMISTSEDHRRATLLPCHCVCSMTADVMERSHDAIFPQYQENWDTCHFEGMVIAGFGEPVTVG